MSTDIKSGVSASNVLTVCPTCKGAITTCYRSGDYNSFSGNNADSYKVVYMNLGGSMVAGNCFFSLTASSRPLFIQKLLVTVGFTSSTPTATYTDFGMARATGTPAGGSGTFTTTNLAARVPGTSMSQNGVIRYGPTIITGLTDDSAGDLASFIISHQVNAITNIDLIQAYNRTRLQDVDHLLLNLNESLVLRVRSSSVDGTIIFVNIIWSS